MLSREGAEVLGACSCVLQCLRKRVADVAEDRVDGFRNIVHAADCSQGDQRNQERVLNQVLAFLAAHQVLDLNVHLQKKVVHVDLSK